MLLLLCSRQIGIMCFHSFFWNSFSTYRYSLFAAALQYTRILHLDLSCNSLSDNTVRKIMEALWHNRSIVRVNLKESLTSSQLTLVLNCVNPFSPLEMVYTTLDPSPQDQELVKRICFCRMFNPRPFTLATKDLLSQMCEMYKKQFLQ